MGEKSRVEKLAADQAVASLKAKITAESNDKIRTKEFVDNVVRDLKRTETERLTPIVKNDILKNLEKTVPAAIASPKFEAQVAAALLELKAKLAQTMRKELEEPLKRVAELTLNQQKKDKEKEIAAKVQQKADKKLAGDIAKATKDPKLMLAVQAQADRALKRKIEQKVQERTKEEVNKQLG